MLVKFDAKARTLTITLPVALAPSKSGKTTTVATSRGNQSFADVLVDGLPVTVGCNAYIQRPDFDRQREVHAANEAKAKAEAESSFSSPAAIRDRILAKAEAES